jgi:hypothetical protein
MKPARLQGTSHESTRCAPAPQCARRRPVVQAWPESKKAASK